MKRYSVFFLLIGLLYACNSMTEEQADEILQKMEEKDSRFQEIANDTVIFKVRDYFVQKGEAGRSALAHFYCGRVHQERDKYREAMEAYTEAEVMAKATENYTLLGTIYFFTGRMYYKQLFYNQCIERLKASLEVQIFS